jgi:hypothetical protein
VIETGDKTFFSDIVLAELEWVLESAFARRAKSRGASTLYRFESEKKLGALSIRTTLKPPS